MVGRNDPCPCGSGKKYKRCCMPAQQVISLTRMKYERACQPLLKDLEGFCLQYDEQDQERAHELFFSPMVSEDESEPNNRLAFLDWMTFAYPTWDTGEPIVMQFAASRTDDTELELLAAWAKTRPGFYQMVGEEEDFVLLRDCFTDEVRRTDLAGWPEPSPETLLLCRLLPVGDHWRPGYHARILPTALLAPIRPLVAAELERMRLAVPGATLDDLFRERWPLIRELCAFIFIDEEGHGSGLSMVPAGPRRSLGRTQHPNGAPAEWIVVATGIQQYLEAVDQPFTGQQSAQRLWWDVADALHPRVTRPEVWAAGVSYAWHHWVNFDETTQAAVALQFGVSAGTVGTRAREIVRGLGLVEQDDRYADPLDPMARMAHMALCLKPQEAAEEDPVLRFGRQHPAEFEAALAANNEAMRLMKQSKWRQVRAKCQEALRRCPIFVPARNNLALTYYEEGNFTAAIEAAEPVLQTHPEYVFTLALLAQACHRDGQSQKAQEWRDKAVAVYERWQLEHPEWGSGDRRSDRHRLWEALAELADDRALYHLTQHEDAATLDARSLALSAAASERCGDWEHAKRWLAQAQRAEPGWKLLGALADALEKIEQGMVPAFHLDYDLSLESMQQGATRLSAAARAILIAMLWSEDREQVEMAVETVVEFKDPWVAQLLRAVMLRPELPEAVKLQMVEPLCRLGELRPGQLVLMQRDGMLQMVEVKGEAEAEGRKR